MRRGRRTAERGTKKQPRAWKPADQQVLVRFKKRLHRETRHSGETFELETGLRASFCWRDRLHVLRVDSGFVCRRLNGQFSGCAGASLPTSPDARVLRPNRSCHLRGAASGACASGLSEDLRISTAWGLFGDVECATGSASTANRNAARQFRREGGARLRRDGVLFRGCAKVGTICTTVLEN